MGLAQDVSVRETCLDLHLVAMWELLEVLESRTDTKKLCKELSSVLGQLEGGETRGTRNHQKGIVWPKPQGRSQEWAVLRERMVFQLEMLTNPFKGKQKFLMVPIVDMFLLLKCY